MTEIIKIEPKDLLTVRNDIARVYREAFAEPPYNEGEAQAENAASSLAQHSRREGFRLLVARDETGQVVGFSYGYKSQPGQWWHDYVSRLLTPEERTNWLSNCFEFVEVAVLPSVQGQGIGGKLHDALLAGLPYETAVLSTYSGENRARNLYRRRGWATLVPDLTFPGSDLPMVVFGLQIKPTKGDRA